MPAMNSTERIYLRMERPGFPCDIALINVLQPSPEGALPFEAVRAIFAQRAHRAPVLTRMLAPAPLGIGEDRWTQASTLDLDAHTTTGPPPSRGIWMPWLLRSWRCRRTRWTAAARYGRRGI